MSKLHHNPSKQSGKIIAGFVLTAIGVVLLLQQLDWFFFPRWLFSWPMILIVVGLVKRANDRSKNSSWLIMIVIGCLFLLGKIFPGQNVVQSGWPIIIIAAGLWMIFRRKHDINNEDTFSKEAFVNDDFLNPEPVVTDPDNTSEHKTESTEDYLSTFALFGNVKKNILSKTFRGGEIVNIFGGTDLDFSHADLNGQITIDMVQLFGGTKLIVPPHWRVVSDVAAIFGGINDKRKMAHADAAGSGKVLILKGASIFGGVDIKSF